MKKTLITLTIMLLVFLFVGCMEPKQLYTTPVMVTIKNGKVIRTTIGIPFPTRDTVITNGYVITKGYPKLNKGNVQ